MTDTNPELDELIDNLWGRALDMTSPDFSNDEDYLLAQTNYRELCKKEFNKFFSQHEQEARGEVLKRLRWYARRYYSTSGNSRKFVYLDDLDNMIESTKDSLSPTQEKRQG